MAVIIAPSYMKSRNIILAVTTRTFFMVGKIRMIVSSFVFIELIWFSLKDISSCLYLLIWLKTAPVFQTEAIIPANAALVFKSFAKVVKTKINYWWSSYYFFSLFVCFGFFILFMVSFLALYSFYTNLGHKPHPQSAYSPPTCCRRVKF